MTFKEFVKKIVKLKQENPEIAPCIEGNYYLKSINDKYNNFSPCLFFCLQGEGQFKLISVYDLTNYMDREVKAIEYDNRLKKNIVYIDGVVESKVN